MEHSFAPKFQQTNKIFGNNKNASATTKINTKFISNIQFSLTRSYAYIHTEFRVFGNSLHTQNTIIRTEQNRIKHNQISFSHVLKSENRKIVYREKLLSVQFSILERRSFRSYSVAFLASLSFIFCVVALLRFVRPFVCPSVFVCSYDCRTKSLLLFRMALDSEFVYVLYGLMRLLLLCVEEFILDDIRYFFASVFRPNRRF